MHNDGIIYWNNKSSRDFGIVVEEVPNLNRPSRKYDTYVVPGRSGVIVDPQDAFDNIDKVYKVWFSNRFEPDIPSPKLAEEISAWLYSVNGYARLEDTFEPDIYRVAYYYGGTEIENHMLMYGMCDLKFNCRPERWLKSGEKWLENPTNIKNNTAFTAKPLIKVEGSGNVNFTINGTRVDITNLVDYIYIDCESMDCYRLPAENKNSMMTGNFPTLKHGNNNVSKSSGITKILIQPRYWTL